MKKFLTPNAANKNLNALKNLKVFLFVLFIAGGGATVSLANPPAASSCYGVTSVQENSGPSSHSTHRFFKFFSNLFTHKDKTPKREFNQALYKEADNFVRWTNPRLYTDCMKHPKASFKVLFLSDAGDTSASSDFYSLGKVLAPKMKKANPKLKVYSADYEHSQEGVEEENFKQIFIDNSVDFPPQHISDGKFDVIVMRRGLCFCHPKALKAYGKIGPHSCGGIKCSQEASEAVQFLKNVGNYLNLENPGAVAILHGETGNNNSKKLVFWNKAIQLTKAENPNLEIQIVYNEKKNFMALRLSPRK